MHVDFFSGTFYAMRTKYKKRYYLTKDDVAEYFFESLFIICVQGMLCILVLMFSDLKADIQYLNSF